ncbi:hypothetical protein FACS189459_6080 [Bacilli bacterium]|nr:hypothetical protein FACS189459_6080 [Bacilli bacterium]
MNINNVKLPESNTNCASYSDEFVKFLYGPTSKKIIGCIALGKMTDGGFDTIKDNGKINDDAFDSCSELSGTLTIPTGVTSIGARAFSDCSGLSGTLTIPASVTSIHSRAFAYCHSISNITVN